MDKMNDVYYNLKHPASYASIYKLRKATGESHKKTLQWLMKERAYTLHKPARRRMSKYRSYKVPFYKYQFQADLNDMQTLKDGSYKHILTVIDMFTRYAWAIPLKNKTGKEITDAFKKYIPSPIYLQVDQGTEFYNKTFKQYLKSKNIKLFSVYSPQKAAMVERFNRTLKTKMFKYFTKVNKRKWVKILPDLLESYNNSVHRSIKMTPSEAIKADRHMEIWGLSSKNKKSNEAKLKVDDYVRISRKKGIFAKGYKSNWSEEIFQIDSIDKRDVPVMYNIRDYKNKVIVGKFYAEELQKVYLPDKFPIEKIHRKVGNRYLVTFLGYPNEKFWATDISI